MEILISCIKNSQIDIYCSHNISQFGCKVWNKILPFKVEKILTHFHYSTKRVSTLHKYTDFCDVELRPYFKHCETRWLLWTRALKRTLDMWESLSSYFNSHPVSERMV